MSNTNNKLLTIDLRKKVEDKVKACLKIAEKEYKTKFEMPEVRYDIKDWCGGRAYWDKWLIRLNLILLVENEQHFIDNVVPHEVAHLINRRVNKVPQGKKKLMPHGEEWKSVMALLNVDAGVTHAYDCSSIEKPARNKNKPSEKLRVARIIKQILKLSESERELLHQLALGQL